MNAAPSVTGRSSFLVFIFSFCLFLSAFSMFSLQPMVGKMLLPLVGGAPSGWVVSMAFFQVMLLAGYLLAHLLSRASTKWHGAFYVIILLAGLIFLPAHIRPVEALSGWPEALVVFVLLTIAVALPFIALSITSSTVQRLFTTTSHGSAEDPYFLYMASNLGSFGGLLLYPLVIEPFFKISEQAVAWSFLYGFLIFLAVACVALSKNIKVVPSISSVNSSWKQRCEWVLLSFLPSSLLLGVTTYITTDVMSAPLIWVIPLALYLLTFIFAFSKKQKISTKILENLMIGGITLSIVLMTIKTGMTAVTPKMLPFHLMVFFIVAFYCHQRLFDKRPPSSQLTEFYLMLSIGGALGGVFNAFIAPNVFDRLIEYPLILVSCLLLLPFSNTQPKTKKIALMLIFLAFCFANTSPLALQINSAADKILLLNIKLFFVALIIVSFVYNRSVFIICLIVSFLVSTLALPDSNLVAMKRNFYGVIKVHKTVEEKNKKEFTLLNLQHGTTLHGSQVLDKSLKRTPTSYYSKTGPLGDIFKTYNPLNVGVIGLGTGAIHCYADARRQYTFFEIDPAIEQVARQYFSFLSDCKSKAPPKIIIGDGRLQLEKMTDEKFDLLVLDAFSSDVIPVHLLTSEAFLGYKNHITKNGIIAFHISNRFFDLREVIARTAHEQGLSVGFIQRMPQELFATPSRWAVIVPNKRLLTALEKKGWQIMTPDFSIRPWTDDYTNLLSTLELTHAQTHRP